MAGGSVPSDAESARLLGPATKKTKNDVPWVLTERDCKVARLYARDVHGERPAVCRWCSNLIPAGTRRLKFALTNTKGWVIRQGVLHVEPCEQSPELRRRLYDDACEAAVTESQYEECRAAGMFEPCDITKENGLVVEFRKR
jgi:hypothetical protein